MNRIYKIIWSRARNCYVVVSELAKRNGKCSSSLNKKIIASFLAAGVTVTSSIVTEAADPVKVSDRRISNVAAGIDDNDAVNVAQLKYAIDSGYINFAANAGENQKANFGDTVTIKGNAVTVGSYSANNMKTTIAQDPSGSGAVISVQIADNPIFTRVITTQIGDASTATGSGALAWGKGKANEKYATAWGENTTASGFHTTAFGSDTKASGNQSTAWGEGAEADGYQATAFGNSTIAKGDQATAWGNNTKAITQVSTAWGDHTTASGTGATAFGNKTTASGEYATTWGASNVTASGNFSTAWGYIDTTASGVGSTAFGTGTSAKGNYSTAFGGSTTTTETGVYATAFGYKSTVSGWGATAAGRETTAGGNYAHAWGYGATTSNEDATAFGYYTTASGYESTAWGQYSKANGEASTAWGYNSQAIGKYSTAFGNSSMANAENSLAALGATTTKEATNSFAIGKGAKTTLADSAAIGSYSVADRGPAKEAGYDVTTGKAYTGDKAATATWTATMSAVSIGGGTTADGKTATRQITGVAAGSADTDAVNVAQLKRVAERIAPAITIKAGDNITIDEITNAAGSIEYTIHAQGFGGTGTGSNISSDNRAVTLTPNKDTDEKSITSPYLHINGLDKAPTADYAKADGTDSIAIGRSATVTEIAPRGVAIGNRAMVNNKDAVALGSNASATNHFSVALGPNAEASIHTSVALGSHSVTTAEDKAGIRTGKYGYDVVTNSQYKGVDRFSPTWQSTAGSVSVGGGVEPATGDTVTRRISNVAAGIKDTDVVNVAQLKRATNYLTDHRSTSIGTNANGEREIVSPYLAMHGVEEAAQAKSLINAYGQVKDYTDALQKDISTLKVEKASLNRDVTNLTNQISDLDARMAAINDKKSEAYKDLANERAILNEEKATLSKELNEVTEMLAEREGLLKTAETDYNKAKDLASDHAYVEGEKSFAQGSGTKVVGKESMAQGSGSTVIGDQSMAIGTGHEVYGSNSGAIGDPNVVAADESYAIGNNNNIGGVTKDKADIKTKNIFVYGNSNKIEAGKSHVYVLGSNVTTVESNSVILGNESAVYAEANNRTAGTGAYKSETINGKTYNYAGGDNEVGVVSVGNADAPRRIQNVAPGKVSAESTDAINGSQLYGAMTEMNNNVNSQIGGVEHRMKKGLAGAAALAALHPLDFDPDDKLTFAAGMGHYRGENAAALGMFYRPDEKVMFSVGGTMGNGENMINAGVSFSLDRTARVTGSRTALTKEVVQLREHVAKQDAQIAELTALVKQLAGNAGLNLPAGSALPGAPALFPDNLDNQWAYDTLEELEQKGYITGYAGRALSRQQFAAALDMAMAGGAKLDERIVKEFEPELSHVRVAQVEGKGNYEGEWYERPRASHDRYEDKQKIEKKHFRVQEKKVTSKP